MGMSFFLKPESYRYSAYDVAMDAYILADGTRVFRQDVIRGDKDWDTLADEARRREKKIKDGKRSPPRVRLTIAGLSWKAIAILLSRYQGPDRDRIVFHMAEQLKELFSDFDYDAFVKVACDEGLETAQNWEKV